MLKHAEKTVARVPLAARPKADVDRKSLRQAISERFSKTLEYLAK